MSNCRLKYAKDIADNIIKESNLDNTSAIKLKENVNQYLLPIGGKNGKNEKLQTIKNTYEWAKSIQDWANNHYDSKRLGNTVYINDDPQGRGTIVTIMMPKLLIDAYENKFGQMSNEDFNSLLDKKEYYDALDKAAVEDSIKNDKQDTHLREKYFAKNDESPASRILRRISKTSHPLAKLAEKLESYVSINDVTIKLVPKIKYTDESAVNNSAGVYYHNTNSIEIAEYANFPAALAESVLIHEIIHALTVKQLRSNSTVNKDFTELYEYVKTKLPAYNKANNTGTYATTSLDEFMVGIFTDANFIKQLKDIPPFKGKNKYKNFFEEVFNTILNALGIKTTDNVYEEAFSIASNIIEDARESSLANELYNQSSLGIENEFNSNQQSNEPKVNFDLKVVNKIESNISKINGWFKQMKDTDQFWKKVQSDLAIPKEQVELLRQSEGDTIEQKLVDFVSKYSQSIEINTAKRASEPKSIGTNGFIQFEINGQEYSGNGSKFRKGIYPISEEEFNSNYNKYMEQDKSTPTQHYSNLTVPGGTNYTENEISTPGITPSIKGHAQFSTDNGIGWFRSDVATEDNSIYTESSYQENFTPTKTRRILEVQSDLFQKGRNRSDVVKITEEQQETFKKIRDEKSFEEAVKYLDSIKENQFLQLLNKDNNWVTFFIKSIIQDSAKKGYEKVLFPSGNTASKVEGHTTLEDFKKQKEDRIKDLESKLYYVNYQENNKVLRGEFSTKEQAEVFAKEKQSVVEKSSQDEYDIKQLKQQLKDLEEGGFAKLKPIYNFYENTVKNILKKNYKINEVTDEYGNTWNEIELSNKDLENILLQNNSTVSKKNTKLEQDLKEYATLIGVKVEFVDSLVEQFGGDYTAAYDSVNKIIYINEGKAGLDTFAEEVGHVVTLALGDDHFLVKKVFNLLSKTDYKSTLDPEYVKLYKNNESALKHEVIGKIIAKILVKKYEPKTEQEFKLFAAIMQMLDKFISMFKRNDRIKANIEGIAGELANKITNKEVVAFDEVSKENSVYFQVDTTKVKSKVEDIKEQFVYLKQQLKKNIDKLSSLDKDDPDFPILRDKIKKNKAALEELEATGNKQIVIDLGNELLDNLEIMLNNVEDPDIELKLDNKTINAAEIAFEKLSKVPALAQRAMSLEQRLQPIVQEYMVKDINDRATEGREITKEEILGTTSDVSKLTGWFGKLSNSPNYIARTIHQMIKEVQSKVSAKNKENLHSIKEEVEALRQWSKDNGISEEDMYDIFIQEHKNTTVLTRRFTPEFYKEIDAAFKLPKSERYEALTKLAKYEQALDMWIPKNKKYINDNFTKIQSTPALKRFYDFHISLVKEAASKLPVKINPEFIANISSNSLKDALKSDETTKSKQLLEMASNLTGINIKQFKDGTYALDEGLFQDLIPLKFIASMDASKKSKNLGDNLAKFVNFANNYEEMSEILPTIRSMQNQLGKQSFTKSSDPTIAIKGVETNIYKFIDTVIDMQVKGNMKKDELKIKIGTLTDDEGNPIGEKYIHGSKVADFGMKYNSLLRIGLNPINAITNLLVGDIGNIIEAFGGRFYTLTNLKDASNIFFKDALNEDSDLNHWRDKIGPLQELEDYETVEQVSTGKGINKEKVENFMYMPQKLGETWLQNRTMVAILLKDGYMDSDGKTTEKGKNITETELKRLINKCYEVNNKIHGRYSSRDAAAISQQVLPRMMMQFKKWIPAAIESRFESKHFNVDLGVEVEGRYKTGWRLLKRALEGDLKALQAGNMTELELYNMKKNLAEIVIALAANLSFIAMGAFGDDDEELKKNPYYKFTMDQLDRLSEDLLYFYNPGSYTETVLKPIALAKTTSDVINCMVAFPHIFGLQGKKDVYDSGSRVNENKFIAKLIDITPIASPVAKVARNFKDNKYQKTK